MGGTLELVARFPDRPAVVLSGLAGLDDKPAISKDKPRNRADGLSRFLQLEEPGLGGLPVSLRLNLEF